MPRLSNSYQVSVAKEYILSAGQVLNPGSLIFRTNCREIRRAVNSPQILKPSGIGDRKVLEPLEIHVQVDLPSVGTNVQEHITNDAFLLGTYHGRPGVSRTQILTARFVPLMPCLCRYRRQQFHASQRKGQSGRLQPESIRHQEHSCG